MRVESVIFCILVIASPLYSKQAMTTVEPSKVFSNSELFQINEADNKAGPDGSIHKGRHGYTHYVVDRHENSRKLIVLSHGIGTSQSMYQELSNNLVDSGYSTLRYDFFGHGYSKFDNTDQGGDSGIWFEYEPKVFVDQLEDLLDHVTAEDGECREHTLTAIVGHSTGGAVAIHAADRWSTEGAKNRSLPKIVLLSPALWASKPLVARIADKIPGLMQFLMHRFKVVKDLVGKACIENMEVAFSKNESTGRFIYETIKEREASANMRRFGFVEGVAEHPFIAGAIFSTNRYMLSTDLQPCHREILLKVLKKPGEYKTEVLFVWGNLDRVVPFKDNIETVFTWEKNHDNLECVVLESVGHECLFENSDAVFGCIVPFVQGS